MPIGPDDFRHMTLWAASMNPLFAWSGFLHAMTPKVGPVYREDRLAKNAPIDMTPRASDPGIRIEQRGDTLVLSGKAKGDKIARDVMGLPVGGYARSVSVGLDVASAPTETVTGRTDYTEKNSRHFSVVTNLGQSAHDIAQRLGEKIDAHARFSAKVTKHADGSASIQIKRS